ncbi:ankyrin repeat domain-containing protein [Legionella rowbothamii]|uniref:ankyrin repeat domain-containing protein n=1 Tax=Legionella rowbothamii TaxID=96229 RepID=UPI0013EF6659|nr:ankyrin repeat domain-containing protein [Legionella rowbothamii]
MPHQDLILTIASGKKAQTKQLANMTHLGKPVYRAKINDKDRLVYTYQEHEGQKKLMVLMVMEDHDYDKLRRILTHSQGGHEAILEHEPEPETLPILSTKPEQLDWHPAVSYMSKTLLLDESQKAARQVPTPVIFTGAPGSGKTSLVYTQMLRYLNSEMSTEQASSSNSPKVLFLSPSRALVEKHEKQYKQEMHYAQDAVVFRTWEDLLKNAYPQSTLIDEPEFADWLQKQSCTEPSKSVHYEFSLMTALGIPKYLTLGKRQCHYSGDKTKQGQLLRLWNSWENHLKQNNRIDPMVSLLPPETEPYAAMYLDEAQNLPPAAIRSLIPLALNHHVVSALDSDQCLCSSPYIQNCFETLLHIHCGNYSEEILTQDWRSPPEITALGNRMNEAKHKMDADRKKRAYKNVQSALTTKGRISWINAESLEAIADTYGALADTAVIVFTSDEEMIAEIQKKLKCINVLTPAQAIGLDFETVILWNPFSHVPEITQLDPNIKQEYSIEQWNALNTLYVAMKRSQKRLFIYEEQKRWMQSEIVGTLLGPHPLNELHTSELKLTTPEQEELKWLAQEHHHREEGNIKLAEAIRTRHLPTAPVHPLPLEVPHKAKRTGKQLQKATSSNILDKEREVVKKLLQRIQNRDWSAIRLLLEHDNAEYYLYDVTPKQMNLSNISPNILTWMMLSTPERTSQTLKTFVRILSDLTANKNKKAGSFFTLLSRVFNNGENDKFLILEHVLSAITQEPLKTFSSLSSFLKKNISPEHFALSVNPPNCLPSFWELAKSAHWEGVKRWKLLGADLTRCDENGNSLMILAAMNPKSSIEVFKFLRDSGIDPDYFSGQSNCSAVHVAALEGFVPNLKALKEIGANLNLLGGISKVLPQGVRPIYFAISKGHTDVVRFLLENDACLPTVFDSESFRAVFVPKISNISQKNAAVHYALEKKIQESYQSASILLFPHEQALFSEQPEIENLLLNSPLYQKLRATIQMGFFGTTAPGADRMEIPNEDKEQSSSISLNNYKDYAGL